MSLVATETHGDVAVLRMERADALNALDDRLAGDLLTAVEAVGRVPEIRAVVLTGTGRAFCAGGDLRWLADYGGPDSGEPMRQLTKLFDPMAIELRRMPKAVVAAVNGVAAGAGLSLALCADFRVSARSAFYRVAYGNIAVSPDGGLTWLLAQATRLGGLLAPREA
ncbi:MAG TPA: enoyl-CoA hydratase/isomerase family protein, partial [Acidimicrobiia bacterium]|nr:enoyl-CoA hydratase/isomerase family protein [Acidimicrobiia bacterium]